MLSLQLLVSVLFPFTFFPLFFRRCGNNPTRVRCVFTTDRHLAARLPQPAEPLWKGESYHHDRVRIAYLSADFRQHATAELIAGLIEDILPIVKRRGQ